MKYNMGGKFLISSFAKHQLEEVDKVRQKYADLHPRFDIMYLYNNFQNQPLPAPEIYLSHGDGIVVSQNYLTEEVVKNIKEKGKKIGVWVRAQEF